MKPTESTNHPLLAADMNSQEGTGRKRLAGIVLSIVLILLALGMLGGLVWLGHHQLYRCNRAFTIQQIEILSDEHEQTRGMVEAALASMGVVRGKSILTQVDLGQLRAQLSRSPYLEEVEVHRLFPDTLRISVKPAIPAAILDFRRENVRLKIDQFGIVRPFDLNSGSKFLPRLVGAGLGKSPDYQPGQATDNEGVNLFLHFLREINRLPDGALFEVDQCSIDLNHGALTMFFGESAHPPFRQGTQLILPFKDFDVKFNEVRNVVYEHLRNRQSRPIGKLDARFDKLYVSY